MNSIPFGYTLESRAELLRKIQFIAIKLCEETSVFETAPTPLTVDAIQQMYSSLGMHLQELFFLKNLDSPNHNMLPLPPFAHVSNNHLTFTEQTADSILKEKEFKTSAQAKKNENQKKVLR